MDFSGAKLALFIGEQLLVIRRDDKPGIPYPDHWDLPGGGREGNESPEDCALRETWEEVGLRIAPQDLSWSRSYQRPRGTVWMFASRQPPGLERRIRFGDEGRGWQLMAPEAYCRHPKAVPHFVEQLRHYMAG
jgi:8-oxo-dGTP diphosphatase